MTKREKWLLAGVIVFIFLSWACTPLLVKFVTNKPPAYVAAMGQYGDLFGSINALFSGLAFAGLIMTIVLQRKDLKVQSETLAQQAEETKRMADQLEDQRKLMDLQRIEGTVFQLIKSLNDCVDNMKFYYNGNVHEGRHAIHMFHAHTIGVNDGKGLLESFKQYFELNKPRFERYFKTIIFILQFINDADVPIEFKKTYTNMLSIQLDDIEVQLIYLYSHNVQHQILLYKTSGLHDRYSVIRESQTA